MTSTKIVKFNRQYLVEKINVSSIEMAIVVMKRLGYRYNPVLNRFYNHSEPCYLYEIQKGINKLLLVKRRSFI